ncbi:hypothetical protein QBC38DRAFT_461302 [Podospora fimiseda]|uniref:Uncharacterized protein n=1 Tax=Podospora fimiseda TaxID=252190 RepID=A0AAN7BDC2_9PEZI|nr:hypothetical protein QBC38DRAFT_461302 [Podospora fimiseda]
MHTQTLNIITRPIIIKRYLGADGLVCLCANAGWGSGIRGSALETCGGVEPQVWGFITAQCQAVGVPIDAAPAEIRTKLDGGLGNRYFGPRFFAPAADRYYSEYTGMAPLLPTWAHSQNSMKTQSDVSTVF